jgi:hypothetical protein
MGQDHLFVLTGQRMGEAKQALKLVVELFSLAGEQVLHKLVGANGSAGNYQAVASVQDA